MTPSPFDLSGKVAIVTGGNGGIGLGMARGLAEAGASLAIVGRNEAKSNEAVAELQQCGAKAISATDVFAGIHALTALRQKTEPLWRQIDLLLLPTTGNTYRIAEIEDFVDFIRLREGGRAVIRAAATASTPAFAAIWNNPDDDVYDAL